MSSGEGMCGDVAHEPARVPVRDDGRNPGDVERQHGNADRLRLEIGQAEGLAEARPDEHLRVPDPVPCRAPIERAYDEGAAEYHFLRGEEPYKYQWGAQPTRTVRRLVRR